MRRQSARSVAGRRGYQHRGDGPVGTGRRRRRRERRRVAVRRLRLLLLVLLAISAALAAAAWATPRLLASTCSTRSLQPIALGENSFVTAGDGSLLGVIPSGTNRQHTPLWRMSRWLPAATIAIEDRRFWNHGALDYRAIARSALADLFAWRPVQGGSTLTQQLARDLYIGDGDTSHSLRRKLEQACLAMKLTQHMSKREILAAYLNRTFYGNHAFGAEAGAETYFSRHARELTLPQAALLAGLPQAPSVYDPFRDSDAARVRRNEVLHAMFETHAITRAAYDWAASAPLGLRRSDLYRTMREPYFFSFVQRQLVERFGRRTLRRGGLHVRTTIDPVLQALAGNTIAAVLHDRSDPASALVAIDPSNGDIRAMATYVPSGERLQFNLATQGRRQAGSAFKPFTLAAALEHGLTLDTGYSGPSELTLDDPRCNGRDGSSWTVHNYADESEGWMSLRDATAHSVNTIFAQVVSHIGPDAVVRMAHRLGITSMLKPVCSITLGTQAVSPLEMTTAYATFAARGVRHAPQSLQQVRGPRGGLMPVDEAPPQMAITPYLADTVTSALEEVIRRGTGTAADIGRPVAGKTGTAEDYVDAWFCGYVPQFATCVWIGYPHRERSLHDVEGVQDVVGGSLPAEIWRRFMSVATMRLPVEDFVEPQRPGEVDTAPAA
jgi:penicillin-binding protein 1A